jgi:hypothetical protein
MAQNLNYRVQHGKPGQAGNKFEHVNLREPQEEEDFRMQRPRLSGGQHGFRNGVGDVLDEMSGDGGFGNMVAPRRDKCDDIFDHENSDEGIPQPKTAGEELDADFTDTQMCFSFNVK